MKMSVYMLQVECCFVPTLNFSKNNNLFNTVGILYSPHPHQAPLHCVPSVSQANGGLEWREPLLIIAVLLAVLSQRSYNCRPTKDICAWESWVVDCSCTDSGLADYMVVLCCPATCSSALVRKFACCSSFTSSGGSNPILCSCIICTCMICVCMGPFCNVCSSVIWDCTACIIVLCVVIGCRYTICNCSPCGQVVCHYTVLEKIYSSLIARLCIVCVCTVASVLFSFVLYVADQIGPKLFPASLFPPHCFRLHGLRPHCFSL